MAVGYVGPPRYGQSFIEQHTGVRYVYDAPSGQYVVDQSTMPGPVKGEVNASGASVKPLHPDIVIGLLFALIVVNGFTSGQFQNIWGTITNQNKNASHTDFLMIGGELVFAVGLSLIADIGEGAYKAVMALIIALWILWGMIHSQNIQNFLKKSSGK
jgi:hypothetical protein